MNLAKNRFSRIILISFQLITVISILVTGIFWIGGVIGKYREEIVQVKSNYTDKQKSLVKLEIEEVVDYIKYNRSIAEESLKEDIKERLYEAHDITSFIYEQNAATKSISEIKQLVKDALRPIRFNNGRGYYFACSLEGIDELYPVYPELEGSDVIDLQDELGNYVIRNEIDIVNERGEGYIIDFWKKPALNDGMIYPKITFVKKFEPLGWYIGTGEYLDDVEKVNQQDILARLSEIRFGEDGYIFVNKFDGTQLLTNGNLVEEIKNLKDIEGPDGASVLEKEVVAAKTHDGDFIYYDWNKIGADVLLPKISFIKGIPDWQWIIGAGFYLDDLNEQVSAIEYDRSKMIKKDIIMILTILLGLVILSFAVARWLFLTIKKNFEVFENFFRKAAKDHVKIDTDKMSHFEFKKLADLANVMLDEHMKDKNTIIESELKYKNLVENQGEGVVIGDLEENLKFVNPAAVKILGEDEEKLVKMNMMEFLSDKEIQKLKKQTASRRKGKSSTYELIITRPDSSNREIMVTATPLFDHNKKIIGSIGIFRDITEWNLANKEIEKNRKLLELINKILRHDLTNQLAAIQSGVRMYSLEQKDEYLQETFKKISSSIELIRKMKEFGSLKYSTENLITIDTADIFKNIKQVYPQIDFTINGESNVKANESFYSAIDNIISNSIDHSGSDKIVVDISSQEDEVTIKIRDFGKGIPDEIKDKIFEEGFKQGRTGKSGLGLYIVKEALSTIGGTIEVEDNDPQGTVFALKLKKS